MSLDILERYIEYEEWKDFMIKVIGIGYIEYGQEFGCERIWTRNDGVVDIQSRIYWFI